MITNAFIQLGDWVLQLVLTLFPVWTPQIITNISSSIGILFGYANELDFLLPVSEVLWCLVFVIGLEVLLLGIRLVIWVANAVPMIKVGRIR